MIEEIEPKGEEIKAGKIEEDILIREAQEDSEECN